MRHTISATLLLSVFAIQPVLADQYVGTRDITVHSPARNRDLSVTLWYPSDGKGQKVSVGENRIFDGAPAIKDASLPRDHLPLVLLSHGSGSRAIGMAWIATALAEAGFLVAAPDHPGTTSGDSTPADTPKIWERTDDISTIVTSLTTSAEWSVSVDAKRVGVLGFSLGGSAAMELAGARADLDAYAQYCVDYATSMDCQWFAGGRGYKNDEQIVFPKFDLRSVDKARFEQSNHDARIRSAVLVDPGLEVAFTKDSLKAIDIPLTFINLGSVGEIPVSVLSDQLAKHVPDATYMQVDDSNHFSFLPVCKKDVDAFLKSVGEIDPICEPMAKRDRADIHEELVTKIVSAFQRTLKAGY
ncbi:alpha/beta hydrolase family protein [Agrobacterium rosae]|uniref:Alpha/beta fold hydrolase n=1 Tax=Agrobacterium rosae TaxID=1972867 RepID=A0AAE5S264_9HYPH|nr:alpha/beta fold hydrolase [Agrobacterium rosae]KAA3511179.1 alpha/beta fold hydrolase [Agrobacterium rosae]KAA3518216.1 alpha/beta fold hydrolase [Agrobacterium rosae]MCM2434291.1 alpha/beta fold hydrolase [Agrobacterium rosae]MDX8329441.1 alpha/beta fold hydrolase [Agrobacterium rosae]MQB49572.1 alpha/beta fold hydrolase [Agrobacterium rosae]